MRYADLMSPEGRLEFTDPASELRNGVESPPLNLGDRAAALLEIVICSGYPTQLGLTAMFAMAGYGPIGGRGLSVWYVAVLSLTDTVVLLSLIATFLAARGERAHNVFLGTRPIRREAMAGLPLTVMALLLGVAVLTGIQQLAPWFHTVEHNPLQELIRTPRDVAVFAVVVVVAGGLREEIQRAFLLHRFERWGGGARLGVLVTSLGFGAGHVVQGVDAAMATGLLGAFWAVIYLRRRSVAAPIVSHAGFNLLQLTQFVVLSR